jgi:SNF2 family DNA or RNA helicase
MESKSTVWGPFKCSVSRIYTREQESQVVFIQSFCKAHSTVRHFVLYLYISVKLCNHPGLLADEDQTHGTKQVGRRAGTKQVKYTEDEPTATVAGADGIGKFLPYMAGGSGGRGNTAPVHPEWSGKMFVLYRLMKEMRRPGNGNDKIVIISNYTQTLDLIGRLCKENSWGFCRLDGSVTMKKRQKMVDEFNDPSTSLVAFLLSSKAGGWYVDVKCSRAKRLYSKNSTTSHFSRSFTTVV